MPHPFSWEDKPPNQAIGISVGLKEPKTRIAWDFATLRFKLWSPAQLVVNESQTGIP